MPAPPSITSLPAPARMMSSPSWPNRIAAGAAMDHVGAGAAVDDVVAGQDRIAGAAGRQRGIVGPVTGDDDEGFRRREVGRIAALDDQRIGRVRRERRCRGHDASRADRKAVRASGEQRIGEAGVVAVDRRQIGERRAGSRKGRAARRRDLVPEDVGRRVVDAVDRDAACPAALEGGGAAVDGRVGEACMGAAALVPGAEGDRVGQRPAEVGVRPEIDADAGVRGEQQRCVAETAAAVTWRRHRASTTACRSSRRSPRCR